MTDDLRPIPLAGAIILIVVLVCIAYWFRPRKFVNRRKPDGDRP